MNVLAFFFYPIFDPMWYLLLGPPILFALWAQARVKSAYANGSRHQVLQRGSWTRWRT